MANEFKSSVGSKVTKKEANEWIEKYDQEMREDKTHDTKSLFYGRDALLKILSEEGSTGISFFLALKPNPDAKKDTVQLVLVATKEDGTLIWPDDTTSSLRDDGSGSYDSGLPCPPYCP